MSSALNAAGPATPSTLPPITLADVPSDPAAAYTAELAIAAIIPHPDNPRHFLDDAQNASLGELAASIKAVGLLEPVLVRPIAGTVQACLDAGGPVYQLVAGERRWRACKLAGLATITAIVRDLTDEQALEVLVTENLQREGLAPLEEARGIKILVDRGGWRLEDVAERLGRSVGWVAGRARLNSLTEAWRARLEDPKAWASAWPIGHLLLVTRIEPAGQDELLARLDRTYNAAGLPAADLRRMVGDRTRFLRQAPWRLADGALLPEAGACTSCLRRSSANPGLFDDLDSENVKRTDRCLDPTCWAKKAARHIESRRAELRATHGEVVEIVRSYDPADMTAGGLRDYQVSECKKTAEGARPCLVVSGDGAGRVFWGVPRVEPPFTSPTGRRVDPATGKALPKTLAERREDLRRRRIVHAVKALLEQGEVSEPPQPASYLVALAAVFGTWGKAESRWSHYAPWIAEGSGWTAGSNLHLAARHLSDGKPSDLSELLWRKQLLPVLRRRLEYFSGCNIDELWTEAQAFAVIIGADAAGELELATQQLKEPKAWAGLNEDGTPKTIAKATKAVEEGAADPAEGHERPFCYLALSGEGDRPFRVLFVDDGISRGRSWATYWRKENGSVARFKSPQLADRPTRLEAQADLDAYADTAGMEVCCKACGCTESAACESESGEPCSWAGPSLCSACAEVGQILNGVQSDLEAEDGAEDLGEAGDLDDEDDLEGVDREQE